MDPWCFLKKIFTKGQVEGVDSYTNKKKKGMSINKQERKKNEKMNKEVRLERARETTL